MNWTLRLLLPFLALVPAALADVAAQDEDLGSSKLRIEWAEFKKLYDAKAVEVIDVRGADAFDLGHIPGARSLPLDVVEKRIDELKALEKPIVTYCA